MKKLPEIYHAKINVNNNKKCYYDKLIKEKEIENNKTSISVDIKDHIKQLLKNRMYSDEIEIVLKNNKLKTRVVKLYDNYILTIDNQKIIYDDIIEINFIM